MLRPRARPHGAGVIHQIERLDLLHDRTERQPAAVCVARERAGEGETIGASLLLDDAPLALPASLEPLERAEERRPLDPALDRDVPARGIEADDACERAGVDEQRALAKLLAAHRVPAAGDRDRDAGSACEENRPPKLGDCSRRDDPSHPGRVELSVDVVDDDGAGAVAGGASQAWPCDGRCRARDAAADGKPTFESPEGIVRRVYGAGREETLKKAETLVSGESP